MIAKWNLSVQRPLNTLAVALLSCFRDSQMPLTGHCAKWSAGSVVPKVLPGLWEPSKYLLERRGGEAGGSSTIRMREGFQDFQLTSGLLWLSGGPREPATSSAAFLRLQRPVKRF